MGLILRQVRVPPILLLLLLMLDLSIAYDPSSTLSSLCSGHMSSMIACSLSSVCQQYSIQSEYCSNASLVADACAIDMPLMGMCSQYNSTCRYGHSELCAMPMPNALTTAQAKDDIQMICTSDMNMEQCGQCTKGKCDDPLKTLSDMCLMMDMPHCRNWRKMCDGINQNDQFKAICGSNDGPSGDDMPYMRMYFHSGMVDYVLFKEWVPRSSWQYALTWIFVMFIVMFGVFLKSCRNHYDQVQMQKSALESIEKSEDHPLIAKLSISKKQVDRNLLRAVFPKREHFKPNFIRSLFVLPIVTIDFSVMLIAMTFNIGLFIAVLVGYTIGTLLFGHGLNNIDSDLDCCNT